MAKLELSVQDAAGARIALENGADRIELCAALVTGGMTPSLQPSNRRSPWESASTC